MPTSQGRSVGMQRLAQIAQERTAREELLDARLIATLSARNLVEVIDVARLELADPHARKALLALREDLERARQAEARWNAAVDAQMSPLPPAKAST